MTIYLVLGDTPRSDSENIIGAFTTLAAAQSRVKTLEYFNKDTYYLIDPIVVEEE